MRWYEKIGVTVFIVLFCVLFVCAYSEFNDVVVHGWLNGTSANFTDVIAENITANEHLFGNLSWNSLSDYPTACTSGSWISQLYDSITCTAPGTTGPFVSWSGYNLEFNSSELNETLTHHLNENRSKNVDFVGNVTAENVFLPALLVTHTNNTIPVATAGVWYNITYDLHDDLVKINILHTYNDDTNDTFTINDEGHYRISWSLAYIDTHAAVQNDVVTRILLNNAELDSSLWGKDTTLQNTIGTIHHNVLAFLSAGDEIKVQFTSSSDTVSLQSFSDGGYGTYAPSSSHVSIHKVTNS